MISCQFGSWKQVLTKKYTSLVSMQKSPVMKKVHSVRTKPTELTAVRESRELISVGSNIERRQF